MPSSAQARPGPRPSPRRQTRHVAIPPPRPNIIINGDMHRLRAMPPPPMPMPGPYLSFPPPMHGIPVSQFPNSILHWASKVMIQATSTTRSMCNVFQFHPSAWTALQPLYNHAFILYHLAQQIYEMYCFLPQVECVARGVNQLQNGDDIDFPSMGTIPDWEKRSATTLIKALAGAYPCLCSIATDCSMTLSGRRSQLVLTLTGPTHHWDSTSIGQKVSTLNNFRRKIKSCLIYCKFIRMVRLETLHRDFSQGFIDDSDVRGASLKTRIPANALSAFWDAEDVHDSLQKVRERHNTGKGLYRHPSNGTKNLRKGRHTKGQGTVNTDSSEGNDNRTPPAACTQDLYAAIASSDYVTVQSLINAGVDLDSMLEDGTFVLSHAVDDNNGALVTLLGMCGANPNVRHRSGSTPLHFATNINRVAPALILLEMGAEVDARNSQGLTPLHVACRERHLSVIMHLLSYGADPNAYDNRGITPLGYAILHPKRIQLRFEIINVLLTYGAVATAPGHTLSPLAQAVIRGDHDWPKTCAKDGVISADSETVFATTGSEHGGLVRLRPLYFAVLATSKFHLGELTRLGADIHHQVSCYGESASYLSLAVHSQTPEIISRLLAHGADPNAADRHGVTPLHLAAERLRYSPRIASSLMMYGANHSAKTYERHIQPLHTAAYYSRGDICVSLIEKGADANEPVKNGISPFMLAIYGGSKSTARCLMGKGADPKYHTPRFGETAMHSACRLGSLELAAFVLEEGLSVDATYQFPAASTKSADSTDPANSQADAVEVPIDIERGCRGFAPIHIAAACGHLEMVRWLLKNGADAEARIGRTVSQVCLSTDRGLVAYCKDTNEAIDVNGDKLDLGQTAAQVARLFRHDSVAFCIEDYISRRAMEAYEAEEALLHPEQHPEASPSSESSLSPSPTANNAPTANYDDSVQPSPST